MEESKFFTKGKVIIIVSSFVLISIIIGFIFIRRSNLRKAYIKLENQMTNAAPNYLLLEKITLKTGEYRKININEIIKDKLVTNSKAKDCKGYVIAKNENKSNTYKTYLNCKSIYTTTGYGSKETGTENKTKTQSENDTTKPVITLFGASKITVNLNSEYKELGATAYDNVDKDLTSKIKIKSTVDTTKVGTYKVTYTVSDKAGNKATKTREVIVKENVEDKKEEKDTTVPIITFKTPDSYQNVCIGSKVDISKDGVYGYTAQDNVDGELTNEVKIEGDINESSKEGTYTIKYSVKDKAGNEITASRNFSIVSCSTPSTTATTPSVPQENTNSNTSSSSSSSSGNSSSSSNSGGTPSSSSSSSSDSQNRPDVNITNTKIDVKSIEAPYSLTISVGETSNINATVLPSNATNKSLTYQSTNQNVVTVTSSGDIRGVSSGSARIIITAHNGVQKGVSVTVQ